MSTDELRAWLDDWYDRTAGPGESWTTADLAVALIEAFDITPTKPDEP